MRTLRREDLEKILEEHGRWVRTNGKEGARASFARANLTGVSLSEKLLSMADFSGARLTGASLVLADLSQANFSDADLSRADLSGADILLVNLSDANLSEADLSVADLTGANMAGASLSSALLPEADLSGADLSGADLSGADLTGAHLSSANLSRARLHQTRLTGADLSGARLSGAHLVMTSLLNSIMADTDFSGASLDVTTLSQIPAEIRESVRSLIRETGDGESGVETILRPMRASPFYYSAALSIMSYFAMILSFRYSWEQVRVSVEMAAPVLQLKAEVPDTDTRRRVSEVLRVYGLFLLEELDVASVAGSAAEARRLKAVFAHAGRLLRDEYAIAGPGVSLEARGPEANLAWLRRQVGTALARPEEAREDSGTFGGDPRSRAFLSVLKGLMEHHDADRPELALMFQKIAMKKAPDETDILEMEKTLTLVQKKSPVLFRAILDAFHRTGMERSGSFWSELVSEMLDHLT